MDRQTVYFADPPIAIDYNLAMLRSDSPIKITRLTAPGRGAVAVLRVEVGEGSADLLDRHFAARNGMPASQADVGRILYGDWGPEDVVVVRTASRQWEVNCHGGEIAAGRISSDLLGTQQPPHAGSETPNFDTRLRSALMHRLLECRTKTTARFLLAQQQGVLPAFLDELRSADSWADCLGPITNCLAWKTFSDHLTQPWQVAIVGQPNVGKSSLLNAMVGYDRSIVFDQPGTTRDRVEADVVLEGWPFRLIDTAGIRDQTSGEIESVGVDVARASLQNADACVLVVDGVLGWTSADQELLDLVPKPCKCAVVFNKSDVAESRKANSADNQGTIQLTTSATDGTGIPALAAWLPSVLIPETPPLESPLPVVDEVCAVLMQCVEQQSLEPLRNVE